MSTWIRVNMKNGKFITAENVSADEVEGWQHMLTSTAEGERLDDTDFVTLTSDTGTDHIRTSEIMSVSICP